MSKRSKKKWQYIRQKFSRKMKTKLIVLYGIIIGVFILLIYETTRINAENGEKYTKIVLDQQQYNSRTIPFKRGDIVDRNGTVMATSERVYNVILDNHVMLASEKEEVRNKKIETAKEAVSTCFGIEPGVIDKAIEDRPESPYIILKKKVSYEEGKKFEENYPGLGYVWLEEDYIRSYPYQTLASHLIGFTVSGNVGNAGLESSYNDILNGTDGREYGYLDAGSALEVTVKEPVNGQTVVSTIDVSLQSIVEKHILAFNEAHKNEVREGEGSKNTAVIIANPNNGEILAQASYPNYDLNNPRDLTKYYSEDTIRYMTSDEKVEALTSLWRDFCVSDSFEPGSTVKPFTEATGLENGTLSGTETYLCEGYLEVADKKIACHKTDGHGIQNLQDGIANSCNVVMMKIAEVLGEDEFCKYQDIFGLGRRTGIDLPAESSGILYYPENMGPVELATNSMGQGFTLTMTQMLAGFSSIINGGNYYKPHVVKQIQDSQGNIVKNIKPVLVKKTVSEETSEILREYMKATMTEGTGKNAQIPGYSIGAKTGTGEKLPRKSGKHILSYMGFAPVENPEVVVYVLIDEPNVSDQTKSKYVTDLARDIMTEIFPYLDIPKEGE